jgi:hypothetical protein
MANVQALTVTTDNPFLDGTVTPNFSITLDWSSAAAGTVSLGIAATFAAAQLAANKVSVQPTKIKGNLAHIETSPGLLGAPATSPPTDQYDITLLDPYSLDVATGKLANRSNTAAEQVVFSTPYKVDSELTLTITAAGDGLKGRMILHFVE